MAMTAVALGKAGLPHTLSWGPGHYTGEDLVGTWEECKSCVEWYAERQDARTKLIEAGIDPVRWLGNDESYLKLSHGN
jgi:hypothetical protein